MGRTGIGSVLHGGGSWLSGLRAGQRRGSVFQGSLEHGPVFREVRARLFGKDAEGRAVRVQLDRQGWGRFVPAAEAEQQAAAVVGNAGRKRVQLQEDVGERRQ